MNAPQKISFIDVEHNDRLRAIEAALAAQGERLDRGSQRMDLMQHELTSNTSVTTEVRDILETFRAGMRVLGGLGKVASWVGRLVAAGTALWGAYLAIRHGKPPVGH